jgi:hypothetical protein
MEGVILAAAVVSAIAATAAVVLPIWRERPSLHMAFTDEFLAASTSEVIFTLHVKNRSSAPLYALRLYAVTVGETLGRVPEVASFDLRPHEPRRVGVAVSRSLRVELGPNEVRPRFRRDVHVVARTDEDDELYQLVHPAGGFSPERATLHRLVHRRREGRWTSRRFALRPRLGRFGH